MPAATQGDLSVVVEAACRATPSAPPGERVSYSSTLAHAVLAEAVRRCDAGDARFRDILAREVFAPLDMRDSALGMREDLAARVVPVVVRDRAPGTLDPDQLEELGAQVLDVAADTEIPGAGVVATAADVFAFIEALRRGGSLESGRILSPATVAFATQNQTGDKPNDLWGLARELYGWPLCPAYLGHSASSCEAGATSRPPSARWRARRRSGPSGRARPYAGPTRSAASPSFA